MAATRTEQGMEFGPEAFAYVPNASDPTTWRIRLYDTPDTGMTQAQVSRAVAALSANHSGRMHDIPPGALESVKARILDAWMSVHPDKTTIDAPVVLRYSALATAQFAMQGDMPPLVTTAEGQLATLGLKVFKVGAFKDSLGRPTNFTSEQLQMMVDNYYALRDSGVVPNVPVRADHSISVENIVGYVDGLSTDGEYLLADMIWTEPDGAAKYARGTYRNRSAEIGPYETNSGEVYWPVFQGFAWCDLPAVEGLYNKVTAPPQERTTILFLEEQPVPEATVTTFSVRGVPTADASVVQAYIAELEARKPQVATFNLNGAPETDVAKVQTHIATLENFAAESVIAGRKAYVEGLVTANKIAAPQKDGMIALVAAPTFSAEQFEAFKGVYDAAPAIGAFAKHAGDGDGRTDNDTGLTPEQQAAADDTAVIAMHKRAGMAQTEIEKLPSFRRLNPSK